MRKNHIGDINDLLRAASEEIKRMREERVEYRQTWLEWLEENNGLTIEQWLLAYADATPEPTEAEDDETICGYIDRRMRAAAEEIKRLREERDSARRQVCEYQPNYFGDNSVREEAENVAATLGWDCFKDQP